MSTAEKLENNSVLTTFKKYQHFSRVMLDGWAIVNIEGQIVKANQLFSQLVEEKSKHILKADSFDDILSLYIDDNKLSIQNILKYKSPTRIDEVRGENKQRNDLNLIIGVYPLFDEDNPDIHLGSFILIRDVTAEKNLHDIYKTTKTKSITDPLTGLYTRRYFDGYLEVREKKRKSIEESDEINNSLSLLMIDIDYFKKVNDVYGHQAGDFVLKTLGEILSEQFRKTDIPCRYGGEEFLVILTNTNLKGALVAAEKLRVAVENYKIIAEGTHIPITISCGVAAIDFKSEPHKESLKKADAALYQSKKLGRNMVSYHDGNEIKSPNTEK